MKINGVDANIKIGVDSVKKKNDGKEAGFKETFNVVKSRNIQSRAVSLKGIGKGEIIQNYSEWYFKLGKTYEQTKDYKQAISAYEKSYAVKPDVNKAESVNKARSKEFGKY